MRKERDRKEQQVEDIFRDRRLPRSSTVVSNARPMSNDRRDISGNIEQTPWYLKINYVRHGA